jgi:hypothetical protein
MKSNRLNVTLLRHVLLLTGFLLIAGSVTGQEKKEPSKPDVKIRVEKKTDEAGNITQYDSLYQWSWSGNDSIYFDSLFSGFHKQWGDLDFAFPGFPGISPFEPPFFSDSVGHYPIPEFPGHGFSFRWPSQEGDSLFMPFDSTFSFHAFPFPDYEGMMKRMEEMGKMMQKMQRHFYEHQHGLNPSEPGKKSPPSKETPVPPATKKKIKGVEI